MTDIANLANLDALDQEDLLRLVRSLLGGGVFISFNGKRHAMEIARQVRPRVTRRVADLNVGSPEEQSRNIVVEGENLQAMVTLYKFRGQVDLILTDPPYNTGYEAHSEDTVGKGGRIQVLQSVGKGVESGEEWVEVEKILQSENQPSIRRGLSLRSVLLLVLLIGVGAGATAYALGTAFAASAGSSITTQQSTSTITTTTGAHNCTLDSLALTAA